MKAVFRRRRAAPGFTLIETLVTVAIAAVLALVVVPSFKSHLQQARRVDGIAAILQVQLAQSRWRANSDRYGSLAEIGVASASSAGYYLLRISDPAGDGYAVIASATGTQSGDARCRHLKLTTVGADVERASGTDASTANDAAANRRCWGL